jgi:hypothetical protein
MKIDEMYPSDELRLWCLQNCILASFQPPEYSMLLDAWNGYDDLTYIQKTEDGIRYFEGWVDSCWQGLFEKMEYNDLNAEDAMRKFVEERFTQIANVAQMKIDKWGFYDHVLVIDLRPIAEHEKEKSCNHLQL